MLFNSLQFLIFFPVVTTLYFVFPHKYRWLLLLIASCYFYMAFMPVYILILFGTIVIDYVAGIYIENAVGNNRKIFLTLSIVANVGVLMVFKYYNFFVENFNSILSVNSYVTLPLLNIILPIGLSFHTFQAMSYTIEVYRGNQPAERHFGIYALYVMFYPQLVAGPIERPQNVIHQFYERHWFRYDNAVSGLKLMAWGMFKKVVIADRLAVFVNQVYDSPYDYQGYSLLVAILFFSIQIYCDFSGYSDLAIGSARVMGFDLMTNFRQPYFSTSISEFWRRWHISLSTWFRDYVYIPLGGNRVGHVKQNLNLLVVFLLSGLWHGANWTFIIWGVIHGIALIIEHYISRLPQWPLSILIDKWLKRCFVFVFVSYAWIFFRAKNIKDAWYILTHSLSNLKNLRFRYLLVEQPLTEFILAFVLIGILLMIENYSLTFNNPLDSIRSKKVRWAFYYILLIAMIFFGVYNKTDFIYFQF